MTEKMVFDAIEFDDNTKTFTIKRGSVGTYPYETLIDCKVLNEDAKFYGKTKPFEHQVLGGTTFVSMLGEPGLYVGLKLTTSNHDILAVYVSGTKTYANTDVYLEDRKVGDKIKAIFDTMISNK